jgi:predicted membrane metal-binding protein
MQRSYTSIVYEMSLYYGLLAVVLPLIYAVTNQLSFLAVFSIEWLAVSVFLYPIVLILAVIRYAIYHFKKIGPLS